MIEFYTIRKYFFDELLSIQNSDYIYQNFDVAINKVLGNNTKRIIEMGGDIKDNAIRAGDKVLNRHAFFELIVILAKMSF